MTKPDSIAPKYSPVETASLIASPAITTTGMMHELNTYNGTNFPVVDSLPLIEHSSSAAGGVFVGMLGGAITENMAARLESKGKEKTAEKVRRIGTVVTLMGSLAAHLTIESGILKGTPDKWDVVVGFAATAPGLLAGRTMGRRPTRKANEAES